eukprot:1179516-Prorocentrum_minimum.AAC.1
MGEVANVLLDMEPGTAEWKALKRERVVTYRATPATGPKLTTCARSVWSPVRDDLKDLVNLLKTPEDVTPPVADRPPLQTACNGAAQPLGTAGRIHSSASGAGTREGGMGAVPYPHNNRPGDYGSSDRPCEYNNGRPGEYSNRPGEYNHRQGEFNGRPGEYAGAPSEYTNRPDDYSSRPGGYSNGLGECGNRPGESGNRSGEYSNRPGEYSNRPGEYSNRPGEYSNRPGEYSNRPGEYSNRPGEHSNRPGEYSAPHGAGPPFQGGEPVVHIYDNGPTNLGPGSGMPMDPMCLPPPSDRDCIRHQDKARWRGRFEWDRRIMETKER